MPTPTRKKAKPSTLDKSGRAEVFAIRLSPRHLRILQRVARRHRMGAADVIRGWLDDADASEKRRRTG